MFVNIKKSNGVGGIVNIVSLGGGVKRNMSSVLEVLDASYDIANGIMDFEFPNGQVEEFDGSKVQKAKIVSAELARVRADFEQLKKSVGDYIDDIAIREGREPIVLNSIPRLGTYFIRISLAGASTKASHLAMAQKYIKTLEDKAKSVAYNTSLLEERWKNPNFKEYKNAVDNILDRSVTTVKNICDISCEAEPGDE